MSDTASSNLWLVGVCLSIVGSGLSNTGLNVQKYSFMRTEGQSEKDRKVYCRQWRWWAGLSLVILGALGDFSALTFAPQSVIMPVGAFTLVCNVFLAHFWLKERISKQDLTGTLLIIIGAVLVAAFGARTETTYALSELLDLYLRYEMAAYTIFIILLLCFFLSTAKAAELQLSTNGPNSPGYLKILKLHPLSYAGLAGTFGAQSVIFAKSTAELIQTSLVGENQFGKPVAWVLVLMMLCTIFLQTHYLAVGLKHFDALYIVPVFQCFFITLSVLGGAVYFKELENFNALQWIMFPIGVLVIVLGVVLMSSRDMSSSSSPAASEKAGAAPPGSEKQVPYENIVTPRESMKQEDDFNFDQVLDTMIDPVYTPAANDEEVYTRSSSVILSGLGHLPLSLMKSGPLSRSSSRQISSRGSIRANEKSFVAELAAALEESNNNNNRA